MVYSKHHTTRNEIGWSDDKQPHLILIEGAPGVGKTISVDNSAMSGLRENF